jgi:hypothetical protein
MNLGKKMLKNINALNNSKYFAGIAMLVLNIGTKYISIELSDSQEELLKHTLVRRLGLFTIFWIGTKDILVSLILTTIFIIFVSNIFNENSPYCILNKQKNKTKEDYKKCKLLIKNYEFKNPT